MDLNELDVVAAADKGSPLTLKHWATGEDTDVVLHVLGFDSEVVQSAERAEMKAMASQKGDVDVSDRIQRVLLAKVKASITTVENLTDGDKEILTGAALAPYLDKPIGRAIVEQVQAHASDRANLFTRPPAD